MKSENQKMMAKIAVNKSLLKEFYQNGVRTVYLNDRDEFQISLFNPNPFTIGAEISIDGSDLSGIMVLRPGERIWLERYLDKQSKFKFSTYEVESNNSDVKEAIRHNGDVVIRFYKERKPQNVSIWTSPTTYPYYQQPDRYPHAGDFWCTCINNANDNSNFTVKGIINNSILTSQTDSLLNLSNLSSDTMYSVDNNIQKCSTTIETGRVEEGSYSSQKFKKTNTQFEFFPFATENIKLLPVSQKQYNASDLQKVYCTNCGRKLNPKFKFCPYCGEKCI